MGRKSFNSKQNFLAATSLNSSAAKGGASLADQIMETKLRSEQAKLTLLEAELPDESEVKYMRYEDMPPPSPEQEAEFYERFQTLIREIAEAREDAENRRGIIIYA